LETGCVYVIPLREGLNLPDDIVGLANPKSSTGRLDVFTRVICDGGQKFDSIPAGYSGPLYVEVAPRTFPILVRPGDRLGQIRFRRGAHEPLETQHVSIDLQGASKGAIIGYRAKRHSGLVDSTLRSSIFWRAEKPLKYRLIRPLKWLRLRRRLANFAPIMLDFSIPASARLKRTVGFEPMAQTPDILYGAQGSHYQNQGLRLSKHFNAVT